MSLLQQTVIYLLAALITVPLSKRLGFGSILGYLAAGIVIGPYGIALVEDPEHVLHFAELGVVFLLFIIGLELQPSRLWVLRRMVFGLGSAQVVLSAALITAIAMVLGQALRPAIIIGLILALSSTAFVLQMLAEKKQLTTSWGRASFTILLFQDLAVIPLLALLPMLGAAAASGVELGDVAVMLATIGVMIVGGRYLLRPLLRIAARTGLPEIFTATALLVVIGAALIMQYAGMSMVLGAFIAGMLLADSEYRHELEADIAPFKGLLLGLFFIAIGGSVNIGLLLREPGTIVLLVSCLMVAKAAILFPLARLFGLCSPPEALRLAAALSQGGEFAFVLFGLAAREQVLDAALLDRLVLAVAVSMLLTPLLYAFTEYVASRMESKTEDEYDTIEDEANPVVIAGFGRVGQIVGRLLRVIGTPFTALEIDSSQVDVVRRFGNKVYFGDASKLELLRAAGAARAKLFVLAIDDMEASVKTAEAVLRHFPNLTIVARARNRRHEHFLKDLGVEHVYRETLLSSLLMGERVLTGIGVDTDRARHVVELFRERDEKLIREQQAFHQDVDKLVQTANDTARELESLLRDDVEP